MRSHPASSTENCSVTTALQDGAIWWLGKKSRGKLTFVSMAGGATKKLYTWRLVEKDVNPTWLAPLDARTRPLPPSTAHTRLIISHRNGESLQPSLAGLTEGAPRHELLVTQRRAGRSASHLSCSAKSLCLHKQSPFLAQVAFAGLPCDPSDS
eukprot:7380802-Prymnesium_polylepis.1